jgi:hypothetical protein
LWPFSIFFWLFGTYIVHVLVFCTKDKSGNPACIHGNRWDKPQEIVVCIFIQENVLLVFNGLPLFCSLWRKVLSGSSFTAASFEGVAGCQVVGSIDKNALLTSSDRWVCP